MVRFTPVYLSLLDGGQGQDRDGELCLWTSSGFEKQLAVT